MNAPRPEPTMPENLDPRVRRSRQMLHDGLATLLKTKDFDKISIQDIAEASTLNRATFYDHYPDKFALLQCLVGTRFGELMAKRNVRVESCPGALRAIALGVCDYLAETPSTEGKSYEGSMQTAIVGVIGRMLLPGLRDRAFGRNLSSEVVASTVSWAIYGAAKGWVQSAERCPAEHMAGVIEKLVNPVLAAADESHPAGSRAGRSVATSLPKA